MPSTPALGGGADACKQQSDQLQDEACQLISNAGLQAMQPGEHAQADLFIVVPPDVFWQATGMRYKEGQLPRSQIREWVLQMPVDPMQLGMPGLWLLCTFIGHTRSPTHRLLSA